MKLTWLVGSIGFAASVFFAEVGRAQETTAFGIFKTFCVDTELKREAIRAKAMSFGAESVNEPRSEVADVFLRMANATSESEAWIVDIGARRIKVRYYTSDLPASPGQNAIHGDSCTIYYETEDESADSDLASWINLPASGNLPGIRRTFYSFQTIEGKRVPLPSNHLVDTNYAKGVIWQAEVQHWPGLIMSLSRENKS